MQVTPRCQQAIDYARSESISLSHSYLSSGHLLLGLLSVNCGAGTVLRKNGLTQDDVRDYLREHPLTGEQTKRKRGVVVGKSASETMQRAYSQARATSCKYVGTEHVLLALLDEQGGAASGILDKYKGDRETMRQSLVEMVSSKVVIQWPSFEEGESPPEV